MGNVGGSLLMDNAGDAVVLRCMAPSDVGTRDGLAASAAAEEATVDGSESGGSTTKASNALVTSKSLLCQVSPVFAVALGGDCKEASEQVMAVHDFTCDDMGLFVAKHAPFFYLE